MMSELNLPTIDSKPFSRLENNDQVVTMLKTRLPRDAHVYNMARMYPSFQNSMDIYVWNGSESKSSDDFQFGGSTWVVIISIREDFGRDISVSIPDDVVLDAKLMVIFSNCEIFPWNESHLFVAVPRPFALFVTEIQAHMKGNAITVSPCVFYYSDLEEFDIRLSDDISLKQLNTTEGAEFLVNNWRYAGEGSLAYMKRFLSKNPSCGVLRNDEIVSGTCLPINGLIGMLFTKEEHRSQGLGTLTMKGLMEIMVQNGFVPCCTVDMYNEIGKSFHEKIGMKISHFVNFVKYRKPN